MFKLNSKKQLEEDTCIHIFTVSAGMVGVCLTAISLLRVVITLQTEENFADDLISINAVLYLVSCLSSYWALRTRSKTRMHRLEHFADSIFIIAMFLMVMICLYIPYTITLHPAC
jgi:hypothetical protein